MVANSARMRYAGETLKGLRMQTTDTVIPVESVWTDAQLRDILDLVGERHIMTIAGVGGAAGETGIPLAEGSEHECPHKFLKLDVDPEGRRESKCILEVQSYIPANSRKANHTRGQRKKLLDPAALAQFAYFREYLAGGENTGEGGAPEEERVARLLNSTNLKAAAAALYPGGDSIVVPTMLYFNLFMPGQQLLIHTDVPAFRGVQRRDVPTSFLFDLHQTGYLDEYRAKIATGITNIDLVPGGRKTSGGELSLFPSGPFGERVVVHPNHNTGVVIDADSVWHRVEGLEGEAPYFDPFGVRAKWLRDSHQWALQDERNDTVLSFPENSLRLSVSWKAFVFESEAEHKLWRDGEKPLTIPHALDIVSDQLTEKGLLQDNASPEDFAGVVGAAMWTRFLPHHFRFLDSWTGAAKLAGMVAWKKLLG
jgi:hypothetical protein